MLRNYECKTKQASWNETSIKEAIFVLKTNKMGLGKVARTFDMTKDSFRRRLQKLEKVTQVIILILSINNYLVDLEMCCLKVKKKS